MVFLSRSHSLFCLTLVALFLSILRTPAHTQTFGQEVAVFPFAAGGLLADPGRARVYATVPATGSVAVINTKTLKVVASIPIGAKPHGMAMSADGRTLYVANSGSKAAIGVLDLKTLTTGPSLALPQGVSEVACGLDGRLYASSKKNDGGIFQVDLASGAVLSNITGREETMAVLLMSPDRNTLYVYDFSLESYDVSTPTIALLRRDTAGGSLVESGASPALSHDGQLITHPAETQSEAINPIGIYRAATDLSTPLGILDLSSKADTGPQAFSPDDKVLYEAEEGINAQLAAYSTKDFTRIAEVPLFNSIYNDSDYDNAIVLDRSGSYIFVGEDGAIANGEDAVAPGEVVVLSTGRGTLSVPAAGSTVALSSPNQNTPLAIEAQGKYTFTRSGGDLSRNLAVFYTASGEAATDGNYFLPGLPQPPNGNPPGFIMFPPNVTSVDLVFEATLAPNDYDKGAITVPLTLTLEANPTYWIGGTSQATIHIQLP